MQKEIQYQCPHSKLFPEFGAFYFSFKASIIIQIVGVKTFFEHQFGHPYTHFLLSVDFSRSFVLKNIYIVTFYIFFKNITKIKNETQEH